MTYEPCHWAEELALSKINHRSMIGDDTRYPSLVASQCRSSCTCLNLTSGLSGIWTAFGILLRLWFPLLSFSAHPSPLPQITEVSNLWPLRLQSLHFNRQYFLPLHVQSSSGSLPICKHDSTSDSALSPRKFNFMNRTEAVAIYRKSQAAIDIAGDWAKYDV